VQCLHSPIFHRRDAQGTLFTVLFRDINPSKGGGVIAFTEQQFDCIQFPAGCAPGDSVNAGCMFPFVARYPLYRQKFSIERMGKEPLDRFSPSKSSFPDSLCDTHLHSSHGSFDIFPID